MVCVGIDVAKAKHDCFILSAEGEVLADVFTITNNLEGFTALAEKIESCVRTGEKIKVGLEATGHYSYNILGFLLNKSVSLRKTKTDRVDARTIAAMLLPGAGLRPYTLTEYHNEELMSLTRYRFGRVQKRSILKMAVTRLVDILFPELPNLVSTLYLKAIYQLLSEYPGAVQIANAHLTHLKNLLYNASNGSFTKEKAMEIRDVAKRINWHCKTSEIP